MSRNDIILGVHDRMIPSNNPTTVRAIENYPDLLSFVAQVADHEDGFNAVENHTAKNTERESRMWFYQKGFNTAATNRGRLLSTVPNYDPELGTLMTVWGKRLPSPRNTRAPHLLEMKECARAPPQNSLVPRLTADLENLPLQLSTESKNVP
jgi:hypothetical protein